MLTLKEKWVKWGQSWVLEGQAHLVETLDPCIPVIWSEPGDGLPWDGPNTSLTLAGWHGDEAPPPGWTWNIQQVWSVGFSCRLNFSVLAASRSVCFRLHGVPPTGSSSSGLWKHAAEKVIHHLKPLSCSYDWNKSENSRGVREESVASEMRGAAVPATSRSPGHKWEDLLGMAKGPLIFQVSAPSSCMGGSSESHFQFHVPPAKQEHFI